MSEGRTAQRQQAPTLPGALGKGKTCEAVMSSSRPSLLQLPSVLRVGFRSTLRHLSLGATHVALGFIFSPWGFTQYTRGV